MEQPARTVSSDADSGCATDEYTWVPPGLTAQQVAEYMHSLPAHCIPYAGGSIGDRWRATQLLRQLPPQDTEVRYCHGLSDEEKRELRLFSAQRRHDSLGRATVLPLTVSAKCRQCSDVMHTNELAVYATRAEPGTVWHPACFTCCVCMELLVDLVYFFGKDARLYCGRHHAETLKPRCCACDEIIFSDECTEAEGHSWHTKHFVCCDCELPLGGQRYVMTDGRPLCCVCYERVYAAECATCRQPIHVTDGHMVHGSRHWHAVDSCFCCDSCGCSLLGCPFVAIPGKDAIYCADCGIAHKPTNSASYVDKYDSRNCLSPSSPMIKVQEPTGKAFRSKFEGVDGKQYVGHEESPVKAAGRSVSPLSSPAQCKPVADAELQTHAVCMNSASCCDDHRLSAEFQVCVSTREDHDNVLPSQLPSQNEKSLPKVSPVKHFVSDSRLAVQSEECVDVNGAAAGISSPRSPVLIASRADCLDNADEINSGLEELIVEPLWSRNEPDGLVTEDTEVVGISEDIRQRSRKSKNLNVRFDPSTKDGCSPVSHGVYCERWHPSCSRRSLDDSDIPYMSHGRRCHAAGPDGSASVSIRRRRLGHGRHRGQNNTWSDVDGHSRRTRGAGVNRGSGWWVDVEDDCERCSTCSSSSSDSDFDYSCAAASSRAATIHSQTLPQQHRTSGLARTVTFDQQVQHSRKHRKKNCVVS